MRTLTVVWMACTGVIGFHAQVAIAAAAAIVFLVNQYPRKARR